MPLTLIPPGTRIDFLKNRTLALAISLLVLIVSVVAYLHQGLQYGIDFRGGILLEIRTQGAADLHQLRTTLSGLGLGGVELQEFGQADNILIRIERQKGDEKAQAAAVQTMKDCARCRHRIPPDRVRRTQGGAGADPRRGARHHARAGRDHDLHLVPLRMAVRRLGRSSRCCTTW